MAKIYQSTIYRFKYQARGKNFIFTFFLVCMANLVIENIYEYHIYVCQIFVIW